MRKRSIEKKVSGKSKTRKTYIEKSDVEKK